MSEAVDFTRLTVGQTLSSTGRPGRDAGRPCGDALALTSCMGLLHDLSRAAGTTIEVRSSSWRFGCPFDADDALSFAVTLVAFRGGDEERFDLATFHVEVCDRDQRLLQSGTVTVAVSDRPAGPRLVEHEFGTVAWGQRLAEQLNSDTAFVAALATWDGTIGIRCATDEVHLRVYRGRVIEASKRSVHGATFCLEADALTWTQLFLGPSNDLTSRALKGQFAVRGDGYEYLRLSKALTLLVDGARALARSEATG